MLTLIRYLVPVATACIGIFFLASAMMALPTEDILLTKHNFLTNDVFSVTAFKQPIGVTNQVQPEVCIFCHTPHGALSDIGVGRQAPLWNQNLSAATYTLYDGVWSKTFQGYDALDRKRPNGPTGYSKLCLSCHDGTLAMNSFANAPGYRSTSTVEYTYATGYKAASATIPGSIPVANVLDSSATSMYSGDTPLTGTNLQNDHPISFTYDSWLFSNDKELKDPTTIGTNYDTTGIRLYWDNELTLLTNKVQCTSCHNPHLNYYKFLRAAKYDNVSNSADPTYFDANAADQRQICIICHDKTNWEGTNAASHQKGKDKDGFPLIHGYYRDADFDASHTAAQYACLNCHEAHSAQGTEWLLKGGVDTTTGYGAIAAYNKTKSAIENTCYLCHSPIGTPLPGGTNTGMVRESSTAAATVADIYTQYQKASRMPVGEVAYNGRHNPVYPMAQPTEATSGTAVYKSTYNDVTPTTVYMEKVLVDGSTGGGDTSVNAKHVECTDCHNPHQSTSNNPNTPTASKVDVLRGMRGVNGSGAAVQSVKDIDTTGTYKAMLEQQEVCYRCHGASYYLFIPRTYTTSSSTALAATEDTLTNFSDNAYVTPGSRGMIRSSAGNPAKGTNPAVTANTSGSNKKIEFNNDTTPVWSNTDGPNVANFNTSYHPVAAAGRNTTVLFDAITASRQNLLLTKAALNYSNTINCTDCHNNDALGAGTFSGNTAIPTYPGPVTWSNLRANDLLPWTTWKDHNQSAAPFTQGKGPHGSDNNRILRGTYNTTLEQTGSRMPPFFSFDAARFSLCFNCHDVRMVTDQDTNTYTNFFKTNGTVGQRNLHYLHMNGTGANGGTSCANCHYNIHSNIEAANTKYGLWDGVSTFTKSLPPGNGSRLIDFSPIVLEASGSPSGSGKPVWGYRSTPQQMECAMVCHSGVTTTPVSHASSGAVVTYDYVP